MNQSHTRPLLGAHMSIAGGFDKALERGYSIGCSTIQIFTKSNRQWSTKAIPQQAIDAYKVAQKKYNIAPVVAHASYLINLASPKKEIAEKSIQALIIELERCEALNIKMLVIHPGSRLNTPLEQALEQTAHNIDTALKKARSSCTIAIETMAGQGSSICSILEEIGQIISHTQQKGRVGVCIDTCHICAAGYIINSNDSYKQFWNNFDSVIGRKYLHGIHMNDSKKPCGSHIDRHENIGKGYVGIKAFELIMNDSSLMNIPKILETPKTSLEEDRENMKTLLSLVK